MIISKIGVRRLHLPPMLLASLLILVPPIAKAQSNKAESSDSGISHEGSNPGQAAGTDNDIAVHAAIPSAEMATGTQARNGSDVDPATEASIQTYGTILVGTTPDAPPMPATDENGNTGIAEIVVTAQKRSERLQDVPISVTAFSGDDLDAAGVTNSSGLASKTPGLIFDTAAGYAIIFIRGVGTDAFIPSADLSVAPYVDGVYFPMSFGLARALGDIERVEILKGPQGTLFGRNATGGAIQIITKDPTNTFTGSATSSIGNYNDISNKMTLSGPLTDSLSGSISAVYNTRDEYYKLVAPSPLTSLQPYTDVGFNGKLRWVPSEAFDATLAGYYIRSSGTSTILLPLLKPSLLGEALQLHPAERDYTTNVNLSPTTRSEVPAIALTAGVHPGALDIKSISAYEELHARAYADFDGTDANLVGFGGYGHDSDDIQTGHIFTQELQFISNDDSPWGDRLKWIGGLYYLRSTFGYNPVYFDVLGLDQGLSGIAAGSIPGIPQSLPAVDRVLNLLGGILNPLDSLASLDLGVSGYLDTRSYAAYLQGTYAITDTLNLTAGLRGQKEHRKVYDANVYAFADIAGQQISVPALQFASNHIDSDDLSPKLALDYKPFRDVMFYASYQKGFKSGSFNILNLTTAPTEIRPEKVTAYEVGAKTQFFDRHVQLNVAAYRNEIKDLQSQFVSLLSGGVVQFQNAEKASINGVDVDFLWSISRGLLFNLGATWLDGKYDKFTNAKGYNSLGVFTSGQDYSGNNIVRNPKLTATGGLSYQMEVPGGRLTIAGDAYYNDGYYFDSQNSLVQPDYYLLNAHISYLFERWDLELTAFGNNLNDARYYIYQFQVDFGPVGKLAQPSTYGLRLNWRF